MKLPDKLSELIKDKQEEAIAYTINALEKGRQEYLAQRKAGLIEIKSPAQKALENPKSLRFAINAKCYDCTGDQKAEVTKCVMQDCSLWNIRPWQNAKINEKIKSGEIQ